jgi:hypothetical protein
MGQKAAGPLACSVVTLRGPARAPQSVTPLRALYDEDGLGASWLARSLAGRRITCSGLLGPVPGGAEAWVALGEGVCRPCPGCGGDHNWPVGVLVVEAQHPPPCQGPFAAATVRGVLDARPEAGAPAGLRGRLVLRDADFLDP